MYPGGDPEEFLEKNRREAKNVSILNMTGEAYPAGAGGSLEAGEKAGWRLERRLEEKLARWINCRSRSRRSWPRGRLSRRSRRPWKRKKILSGGWWKRWDKYYLESEARKILGVVKSV